MDRVSAVSGIMTTIISVIMVLFTIIAVAITAVQLFLSRVEFWTIGTLILPLLALGTFKHFRFLFEKSIGAVFNAGIKSICNIFYYFYCKSTFNRNDNKLWKYFRA